MTGNERREAMTGLLGKVVTDKAALEFLQDVFTVAEIYDDLIDGDADVNFERYGYFLEKVLHDLPANPFFDANRVLLLPLMRKAVGDWRASMTIESEAQRYGEHELLRKAYDLRTSYLDLACAVVDILHGPSIRHRFQMEWLDLVQSGESFEAYAAKVTAEVRGPKTVTSDCEELFPTLVFKKGLDLDLANIKDVLTAIRNENPEGVKRSNVGGWHSSENSLHEASVIPENLIDGRGEFEKLKSAIFAQMWEIAKELDFSRDFVFEITGMWANINGPGSYNRVHVHPHAQWSGVFYVQVGEGSGKLGFHDPRPQAAILQPVVGNANCVDKRIKPVISYEPSDNDLIVFPGYLPHEVDVNRSETDRISIAFNVGQKTMN